MKNQKRIVPLIFIALILVVTIGGFFYNSQYKKSASTTIQKSEQQNKIAQVINNVSSNLQVNWKEYSNVYFTIKYPPDWELQGKDYFFAFNPKTVYHTSSRPPIIYYNYIQIKTELTSKSAKQFKDEIKSKRELEIKQYNYPPIFGEENFKKHEDEYEFFNMNWGMYEGIKTFAISNGKVLLTGEGSVGSFNDGSSESQILRSLIFKK